MSRRWLRSAIVLLLVAVLAGSFSGCNSSGDPGQDAPAPQLSTPADNVTEEIPTDPPYTDEITGTYSAVYENVTITITADSDTEYYLTYSDGGHTLRDIPIAYFNINTPTQRWLMFWLDDYYPEHSGYVEFCWDKSDLCYNSLIEGLEDTVGYYSEIEKIE